jgi:hypothetical protein
MIESGRKLGRKIIREILKFFKCSSILFIGNANVKYFSLSKYDDGIINIIVYKDKGKDRVYYWLEYEITNDTIVVYYQYAYTIEDLSISNILDQLPESPVDFADQEIQNLYRDLKKGYKVIFKPYVQDDDADVNLVYSD